MPHFHLVGHYGATLAPMQTTGTWLHLTPPSTCPLKSIPDQPIRDSLPLQGEHQLHNLSTALGTIDTLLVSLKLTNESQPNDVIEIIEAQLTLPPALLSVRLPFNPRHLQQDHPPLTSSRTRIHHSKHHETLPILAPILSSSNPHFPLYVLPDLSLPTRNWKSHSYHSPHRVGPCFLRKLSFYLTR